MQRGKGRFLPGFDRSFMLSLLGLFIASALGHPFYWVWPPDFVSEVGGQREEDWLFSRATAFRNAGETGPSAPVHTSHAGDTGVLARGAESLVYG